MASVREFYFINRYSTVIVSVSGHQAGQACIEVLYQASLEANSWCPCVKRLATENLVFDVHKGTCEFLIVTNILSTYIFKKHLCLCLIYSSRASRLLPF